MQEGENFDAIKTKNDTHRKQQNISRPDFKKGCN